MECPVVYTLCVAHREAAHGTPRFARQVLLQLYVKVLPAIWQETVSAVVCLMQGTKPARALDWPPGTQRNQRGARKLARLLTSNAVYCN